jgi:tRNA pseudouridine38-40 synthase
MKNIKMELAYDGTAYLGWQKTKTGASIEGCLQEVLEKILQERVALQAASRTDAGVHAVAQIVNFQSAQESLDLNKLQHSLNCLLPRDIVVRKIDFAKTTFHPTTDSIGKEYHYTLCYDPIQLPQERLYAWHYPYILDVVQMKKAATLLLGCHDFAAFCNFKKDSSYKHYIRTLTKVNIIEMKGKMLRFEIGGDHFLYKMVRNIVGTLAYVGRGKLGLEEIPRILASQDRTKAGVTAPAHGLYLYKVFY